MDARTRTRGIREAVGDRPHIPIGTPGVVLVVLSSEKKERKRHSTDSRINRGSSTTDSFLKRPSFSELPILSRPKPLECPSRTMAEETESERDSPEAEVWLDPHPGRRLPTVRIDLDPCRLSNVAINLGCLATRSDVRHNRGCYCPLGIARIEYRGQGRTSSESNTTVELQGSRQDQIAQPIP
jgi:hypothetical protein